MQFLLNIAVCSLIACSRATGAHPAVADDRTSIISFAFNQEYTLPEEYDFDHTQHLFSVNSRLPLHPDDALDDQPSPTFSIRTRPTTVYRPVSPSLYQEARLQSLHHSQSQSVEWETVQMLGPDVEDQHTLGQLARMTGNAYALPGRKNWYDIDQAWNTSFPFGWEDPADGFRGHVFVSPNNGTIILSIKGTTLQGPTSKKDKFNDNLLFSCCCARVNISWMFRTVCDCYSRGWRCDNQCLTDALVQDSLFYNVGVNLINNLTTIYPTATIWLVGHSLGGALASLLGTTFGLPSVTFEAPGERLAAQRLHLPLPPPPDGSNLPSFALVPVTHVYHTADPIPQGTCTGVGSACASAGYAMESRCHLGKSIVYDTVSKFKWKVDVRKHVIKEVILHVIEGEVPSNGWESDDDADNAGGDGGCGKGDDDGGCEDRPTRNVPIAREELDCVDCYKWEFGDFKDHSKSHLDST